MHSDQMEQTTRTLPQLLTCLRLVLISPSKETAKNSAKMETGLRSASRLSLLMDNKSWTLKPLKEKILFSPLVLLKLSSASILPLPSSIQVPLPKFTAQVSLSTVVPVSKLHLVETGSQPTKTWTSRLMSNSATTLHKLAILTCWAMTMLEFQSSNQETVSLFRAEIRLNNTGNLLLENRKTIGTAGIQVIATVVHSVVHGRKTNGPP